MKILLRIYDIEELYKTIFIITEYLDGSSLKSIVTSTPKLTIPQVVDIALQVCRGLEYAHTHGIIHQDINPNNIFIQSDGQVKIIDFGLACPTGHLDCNLLFPGTIFYIAPEQIKGDAVDERTNIYSLGITVYEMLAGHRPFPEDKTKNLIHLHLHEDMSSLNTRIPDVPEEFQRFFMKTIRKQPSDRYRNISEVLKNIIPLAEKFNIQTKTGLGRHINMKHMFLMYTEEYQREFDRFIEEFNRKVNEAGGALRITQLEDFLIH